MALSTYAELKTAIASLLNRDDLTDYIGDFIRLCETDIDGREDLATHRRRICRSEAIIDDEYEALPDNFLAIQSIDISDPFIQLQRADPDNIVRLKASQDDLRNRIERDLGVTVAPPKYYAIVGTEIRFLPVPQQEYTCQMTVYERLPALESYDTNWVLEFYPSIYLYGSAIHSAPFLKDDARLQIWATLYDNACRAASRADPMETERVELRTELAGCF